MPDIALNTLSAIELVSLTTSGAVSCEAVAHACLARVNAREGERKAWAFIDADCVLQQAIGLDAQTTRGSLHGVPVGVKDVIDVCGMPTGMGSPIYRGYRPFADAACVAQLRAAGALIFGKSVTCEFAGATAADTTNPHDPARTPGGSSSGSAAATADYMVPLALGTQTGGSVQRPASYCGIVGYKPSFGLINVTGMKSAAVSLDTIGLMARTVEDIELAARVLMDFTPAKWLPPEVKLRIGLLRTYNWDHAEAATKHAIEDAARDLAATGNSVRDVVLPYLGDLATTREIINDYERARGMCYEWQAHRVSLSEGLARTIRNGLSISEERYTGALRRVEELRWKIAPVFNDVDVLVTPTVAGEAPPGLSYTGDHRFQSIWTQLRLPAITLPTHAGPNGMPVGIQLVGALYEDSALLAAAQTVFSTLGRGPVIQP
jgi:Asp-tRNA(Asn)/Glu-tRNA(Gln) amidotransferase A subunit family amidase